MIADFRVRLEAETIRDAILHASGLLSLKVGGPSVYPPIPEGVLSLAAEAGFGGEGAENGDGGEVCAKIR